jgi:hypothetical protein
MVDNLCLPAHSPHCWLTSLTGQQSATNLRPPTGSIRTGRIVARFLSLGLLPVLRPFALHSLLISVVRRALTRSVTPRWLTMVVDADVDSVSVNPSSLKDHLKEPHFLGSQSLHPPAPWFTLSVECWDLPQVVQSGHSLSTMDLC